MYTDISKKPTICIFKVDMAGLKGGPAGQTYTLRQDVIDIIGNILLVNWIFHLRKNFFLKIIRNLGKRHQEFWPALS
jgi:hypothetical protein